MEILIIVSFFDFFFVREKLVAFPKREKKATAQQNCARLRSFLSQACFMRKSATRILLQARFITSMFNVDGSTHRRSSTENVFPSD
jgi:hypothetical protein